ncbi:unnamed protein product [Adineta steineri]|uniref:NAD(P)(+)--arginine ADP-ribosyltransferase n=1 Tax=Adineta steineri TaxID=433720 RepID=A0A815KZE5_9BILA|nr:unnamed protein product [Adineta steineri]CAF3753373.1 unnamed protein product [Adineta steineri]
MASFEPVVVVFGCSASIAGANLRLPVSSLFAFNTTSLEQIVNVSPQLSDICLQRYFIILLDSIDKDLLLQFETNHRIVSIYRRDIICDNSQGDINRMTNSFRQLTLDLTNDIIRFLTLEGEKQIKLERISLVKIYYKKARVLKEWAMSLFKAEPCHILLISLNSSQENVDSAQQRLQKVCNKLGYTSTIIRQLNDYIPNSDRHLSLLPYAKLLFNHDNPHYMCRLIKELSPIRFYLYGNKLCNLSEWSKLMISSEQAIMDDEDNWCAFLENEHVDDEVKWNFGFMFGRDWKVKRVAPLNFNYLDENPRFQSALHRAYNTFAERQMEVTAEIFDWYEDCIAQGYLHAEPKLTPEQKTRKSNRQRTRFTFEWFEKQRFRYLSSFNYSQLDSSNHKSISFIWLDEILNDSDDELNQAIKPYQWNFFNRVSNCISFIERQLREQRYIFLIVPGTLGEELYSTGLCLIKQIFATYIYCAHLGSHLEWSRGHSEIRGVYNNSKTLANKLKQDIDKLELPLDEHETKWYTESYTTDQHCFIQKDEDTQLPIPLPLTVYNSEQAHVFIAHQRTIDTLLCMPQTLESQAEMFAEFRRIYNDNQVTLAAIDNFEKTYHSNAAVQWYTRDSFICRTINQALRTSNADTMFKLRYILTDMCAHLNESGHQRHTIYRPFREDIFYRGQSMSNEEFNSFKDLRGSIISINTFLSTTTSMQVALMYAGKFHENHDLISVIFSIEANSQARTRPYANISQYSMFPDEDEVLFAMGSVFQICNIRELPDSNNIWIIHLKMANLGDY